MQHLVRQTRPLTTRHPVAVLDPRRSDLVLGLHAIAVAATATAAVVAPVTLIWAAVWLSCALATLTTFTAALRWPHRIPQVALGIGLTTIALAVGWFLWTYWAWLLIGAAVLAVLAARFAVPVTSGKACRCPR